MIHPGEAIGILGGGQLGRMLALAAARYGLKVHVYAPEADSPAFDVAAERTCAPYEDEAALARFAGSVEAVTFEHENVPRHAAEIVGRHAPLHPGAGALATTQDRLAEKTFVAGLDLPTAPFRAVASEDELDEAVARIGRPAVLKTRRFGYDGKGQVLVEAETDLSQAWGALWGAPCILEGFVPFEREVSVVAARTEAGAFEAYDLCANEHRDHILSATRLPAGVPPETEREAVAIARRVAEALGYVGVLCVEMFLVGEHVVVNEIAPRVHNSGHWTIEGAETSQFEQHVRAVCGWPLGSPRRLGHVEMLNLIGGDADGWAQLVADPDAHLHLYAKGDARPGRKMGHVTRVTGDGGAPR